MYNNNVNIIGHLTNNAMVGIANQAKSTKYAHYTVAVERNDKNDSADYVRTTVFGTAKFIDNLTRFAIKGSEVYIGGQLHTNTYTDKNGNRQYGFEVIANSFHVGDTKAQTAARLKSAIQQPANK